MDSAIITQMRAEEADLARKLKAVRDFLAAYGQKASNEEPPAPALAKTAAPRGKVGITGFSQYGRVVVAESMRVMLPQSHPIKTRQIVEAIDTTGLEITGENKVNALGALLYRSEDIDSHGKAGWTLRDPELARRIVAEHGLKENGAAEAAPDAEGAATPSNDSRLVNDLLG